MKTEEQIKTMQEEVVGSLIDLSGENLLAGQGFARALRWVLSDEQEEEETRP